jgi:GNAT superfamily N-acetyltransferase
MPAEASPARTPLEIERLERLPEEAAARVREIYEEAFPIRQRVPFGELREGAATGDEVALVALEAGRPAGLAFLSRLDSVGYLFVEYFAVASDLRGGGRGQALWRAVSEELAAAEGPRPIVLEVEDPAEAQIGELEAAQRARRVRFWEHVGARMLAVDGYVVPNVGTSGTEPLRLMWIPARPDEPAPTADDLLELVLALYETGYGLDGDHELLDRARERWGA